VFGGEQQRQEWVVVDLSGPAAVVALLLDFPCPRRHSGEVARNTAIDAQPGDITHAEGRYSKQFGMVNGHRR
jgi:hypothetical protein